MDPPQTPRRQGPTESSIAETPGGTPAVTQGPPQTPQAQTPRGPPRIVRAAGRRSPNPTIQRIIEDEQLGVEENVEVLWDQLRRLRTQENELLRRIQAAEGQRRPRPTSPLQTVSNRPSLVSSPSARTPSPTQEKIFQPIRF